jgi:hypothetical protein
LGDSRGFAFTRKENFHSFNKFPKRACVKIAIDWCCGCKIGGRGRDRTGDPLLAKNRGQNTNGFVWCRLTRKISEISALLNIPKLSRTYGMRDRLKPAVLKNKIATTYSTKYYCCFRFKAVGCLSRNRTGDRLHHGTNDEPVAARSARRLAYPCR